jgi:hypothetical protein
MNLSNLLFTEQKHISIKNKPVEGNVIISHLLQSKDPFSIVRCGIGAETVFSYCFLERIENYEERYKDILQKLHNNAGIYFDEQHDGKDKILYANLFNLALQTCTYLANWNNSWITPFESKFINTYRLRHFDASGLEFFDHMEMIEVNVTVFGGQPLSIILSSILITFSSLSAKLLRLQIVI